ncbi:MAG: tetratricopeptide repeat protein [Bacteroidetes bacterium]|nr:tetratricopeptide repeat protein [Bacteroidota bacterium]
MKITIKIALPFVGLLLLIGCSTKKNTFVNRTYHATTTKFNVLYNGQIAFEKGLKQLNDNYADNYWELLPIEPLKVDQLALPGMMASEDESNDLFAKAEEKAVKAIQKHSMRFYNKEKNPQIDNAYLLLGKSRYYSQRFVPALEAFNYVIKNYPDADLINETKVWHAKTNLRLQNEETSIASLKALLKNKNLNENDKFDAHTAMAMSYLQLDSIKQTIYHLKKAVIVDETKEQSARNTFILGQLFRQQKQLDSSNYAFTKIVNNKKSPFKYKINASIELAKNVESTENVKLMVEKLEDLIKNRDNRAYLDKLYYHLGDVYLKNNEIDKAEQQFKKSVTAKNGERFQKVLSYEALGNIHFNKGNYMAAGNYYDSVLNTSTDFNTKRYIRIKRIRKSLDDVIFNENIVATNDSILKFALMNDTERTNAIGEIISKLKATEAKNSAQSTAKKSIEKSKNNSGKWYFYNPEVVKSGMIEFQKKWGAKSHSDNWKFNKYESSFVADEKAEAVKPEITQEYYLANIPTKQSEIDSIAALRNEAYYKLGIIYKEQFLRNDLAIERFNKVLEFGAKSAFYLPATYHLYRIHTETKNTKAQEYKNEIIAKYPQSIYASLVQNSENMTEISDNDASEKAYKKLYLLYEKEEYQSVLTLLDDDLKQFGQSALMPKFELLKAYTLGKLQGIDSFKKALEYVSITYPNTEEGKKALELVNTINKK